MGAKVRRRSPIRDLPVRQAGQSLREEIQRLFDDRLLVWLLVPIIAWLIALIQWLPHLTGVTLTPWFFTVLAAIATPIAWWRISRAIVFGRQLYQGRIGEEAVGQFLEEKLRPLGAQVLHDIPSERGNIDHVVIHTTGIYAIETKTHSKPMRGECKVQYDGTRITVNGFTPDRYPITQAKAEATSLHKLLESSTGKRFKVQPVVLYPGWYVTNTVQWPEVWVQNEKQFPSTIQCQKPFIPHEDVSLATFHLKRYVISETEKRKE